MSSSVRVETLHSMLRYTPEQLNPARRIAALLARGSLVLCEPPGR
jgi:hypothetical protein